MQNAALVQFPKPPRAKTPRITNDKSIQSLPVPATGVAEYVDDLTPGLRLRITAKDVRSWSFRYADPKGKMQRLDMGRLHDITLAEARLMVKGYRKQLSADPPVDPRLVRRQLLAVALHHQAQGQARAGATGRRAARLDGPRRRRHHARGR